MKWQDFYFNWLEKVGYYDWYNATMVEYKNPFPIGSRSNIGTVGFGGDGEPSIQGVPDVPVVRHPAQELIDQALENTEPMPGLNSAIRSSRSGGVFTTNVAQFLASEAFTQSKRNTLRYWGYQPMGTTFAAPSNYYRGYSYFTNAMKQKKELRGRRGDVLVRGSKKQWFTDKKNRTYPSLKMRQKAPMVAIRHPDYSSYGDVGRVMELAWGRMNGLNYALYDPAYNMVDETMFENFEPHVDYTKSQLNELLSVPADAEMQQLARNNYQPGRHLGVVALNYARTSEQLDFTGDAITRRERDRIQEVNNFVMQAYADNKGVLARRKSFRERKYVADRIQYDARQQVTALLLEIDAEMSVPTAEVILQILANPSFGLNFDGELVKTPVQSVIDTALDEIIPLETQKRIQGLLTMCGRNCHPLYQNLQNSTVSKIGSFYLHFPMDKRMFSTDIGGRPHKALWMWNGMTYQCGVSMSESLSSTNGGEVFFSNQRTIEVTREMLEYWTQYEIVDESLMPLVEALLSYFVSLEDTNLPLQHFGIPAWLYSLPVWTNPNYGIAIANSETAKAQTLDWQPKDIGFRMGGQDKYLYEIKLSEWAEHYKNREPEPNQQRYWDIQLMFNQPVTKKSRGSDSLSWLETHQIILDLGPDKVKNEIRSEQSPPERPIIDNNLGMLECNATPAMLDGMLGADDFPSIIYEFWDDVVSWPFNAEFVKVNNETGQGPKGIGNLHSYLTPMDENSEWWNSFLDPDTGILRMSAGRNSLASSNYQVFDGWEIAWDFGIMDSLIQKGRISGLPWAEGINLENYTKKVYPSENVEVHFHPKIPSRTPTIADFMGTQFEENPSYGDYLLANDRANEVTSPRRETLRPATSLTHEESFLPVEGFSHGSGRPTERLMRRNQYGGRMGILGDDELATLISRAIQPTHGLEERENWLNYIANDEGYEVIAVYEKDLTSSIHQMGNNRNRATYRVELSRLRNSNLQNITDAGGVYNYADDVGPSGYMLMEQVGGNLVAIPNYAPHINSWNATEWAELRQATGYSNARGSILGDATSMRASADGNDYAPLFQDAPKVFIQNLPPDSLEVEVMPETLVGRSVEYSMPSGNPWRRGKIFLINWVSILSRKVMQMLQPPEE